MKKHGFTLVEVLLSITIVGIVAALVFPTISKTYQRAQTYPKLQKTISMIEQANEAILREAGTKDLHIAIPNIPDYADALRRNISKSRLFNRPNAQALPWNPPIAAFDGHREGQLNRPSQVIYLPTGVVIIMPNSGNFINNDFEEFGNGDFIGFYTQIIVDLNGPITGPNKYGRDLFYTTVDRNGSVIPDGSWTFAWAYNRHPEDAANADTYWKNNGDYKCHTKGDVPHGWGCAGSVIENKGVIYY